MTRVISVLVPFAIVAAVLVGCTPTPGGAHPSSHATTHATTETPEPIITGSAANVILPQPVLDIDCPRIASASAITAAFGASVHSVDPLINEMVSSPEIPDAYVVQTLGGITCEWSNGVPIAGVPGPTPYIGIQVTVLPQAASQWATFLHYGETGFFCPSSDPQLYCGSEQLVGTTWVSVTLDGVHTQALANALVTSINAVVAGAGPGAPAWTPPTGTGTFGECASLLTPAQAQTDLGVTGATILFNNPMEGWSIQSGAKVNADALGCLLMYTDEDSAPAQLEWLHGGEWAYDAVTSEGAGWGAVAPAAIAGLASGDRARVRCTDATVPEYEGLPSCTVDLELGGNWIQVIYEPSDGDHATAESRAGALALAAHVVAGYNAG